MRIYNSALLLAFMCVVVHTHASAAGKFYMRLPLDGLGVSQCLGGVHGTLLQVCAVLVHTQDHMICNMRVRQYDVLHRGSRHTVTFFLQATTSQAGGCSLLQLLSQSQQAS